MGNVSRPSLLCIGIGNQSRGDDALGPALLDWLMQRQREFQQYQLTLEEAFQLAPENIYDIEQRDAVLFLDADARFSDGILFSEVKAENSDNPFVSHALSPEKLVSMFGDLTEQAPPRAFALSMGAESMELGECLSQQAKENLELAKGKLLELLGTPLSKWNEQAI